MLYIIEKIECRCIEMKISHKKKNCGIYIEEAILETIFKLEFKTVIKSNKKNKKNNVSFFFF